MKEITGEQFQQILTEVFMRGVDWGELTAELDTTEEHRIKAFRMALTEIMQKIDPPKEVE